MEMSPRVTIKEYRATWDVRDEPPLWFAIADYGRDVEAEIPLPAHLIAGDDVETQRLEVLEAMENLAEALRRFVAECRRSQSTGKG